MDFGCLSHALNLTGLRFSCSELTGFVQVFTAIFQNSAAARMAFQAHVGGLHVKLTYVTGPYSAFCLCFAHSASLPASLSASLAGTRARGGSAGMILPSARCSSSGT